MVGLPEKSKSDLQWVISNITNAVSLVHDSCSQSDL